MAYTMVIYRKKLSDGWTLPYVPAGGLDISEDQGTDEFSSINRDYTVPVAVSPMTFAWAGVFPSRAVHHTF